MSVIYFVATSIKLSNAVLYTIQKLLQHLFLKQYMNSVLHINNTTLTLPFSNSLVTEAK